MDFLNDYLVLIVMGVCLCVGYILKNVVPTDKINNFIPLIMGALGVLINLWVHHFVFTPEVLLGGLSSGLASTGMHQAFKKFIDMGVFVGSDAKEELGNGKDDNE